MKILSTNQIYACLVLTVIFCVSRNLLVHVNNALTSWSEPEIIEVSQTKEQPTTIFTSRFCPKRVANLTQPSQKVPAFLWGIPSVLSDPKEIKRREFFRRTYLSYYRDSDTPNRICSLTELTCEPELIHSCQLVYAFFVGANPNAPPERLDDVEDFRSMVANWVVASVDKAEDDVVLLDIRENQFDGKMTTWFKFGSLVAQEFDFINYIAKVDSDTLVFIPNFFNYMNEHLPKHRELTYAGVQFPRTSCNMTLTDHDHPCPLPLVGDDYMSGELNFMTVDLARYITSGDCPRDEITISTHEDVSLSNYVYSHPKSTNITVVGVPRSRTLKTERHDGDWCGVNLRNRKLYSYFLWGHSSPIENADIFKHPEKMESFWKKMTTVWKWNNKFSTFRKKNKGIVNRLGIS